ncbi:MAG: hypothetical protein ABIR80_20215 [Opitutaceae bacterium]
MKLPLTPSAALAALLLSCSSLTVNAAPPVYEPAYVNGRAVTISIQDPHPGKPAAQAQNVYFEVIYPVGWKSLTASVPICNPCDHGGDGDDFFDYHDHVFSGEPSQPGKGEYGPLWRLNFVLPSYNNDPVHDAAVSQAYAKFLPAKSAQAVFAMLAAKLPDGSPIAELVAVDYVFLAAIVSSKAAH